MSEDQASDKDVEIRALRRALAASQSEVRLLRRRLGALAPESSGLEPPAPESPADGAALREALRQASPTPDRTAPPTVLVRLGRGLGLWRSPAVLAVLGLVLVAFAVDGAVGIWQARSLRQERQARLQLEHVARSSLYVELKDIVPEPDGRSYRMTISMRNVDPAVPLWVMLNAVAVYVQVGTAWQQVPSGPAPGSGWGVVKLVDDYSYGVLFTPGVRNFAELIPGYMHVRIQSDMLISRRAQPGEDVAERRTPYYVYLKPHGVSDADIKARMRISGPPPVFIPMPPH
ncbi:MAG: hypothetical protein U1E23_10230 [Reyranellaceae bacterium]